MVAERCYGFHLFTDLVSRKMASVLILMTFGDLGDTFFLIFEGFPEGGAQAEATHQVEGNASIQLGSR